MRSQKIQSSLQLPLKKKPLSRCAKSTIGNLREEEVFEITGIELFEIEALWRAAEVFSNNLFSDSSDERVHAKWRTLNVEDFHITINMKRYKDDQLEGWERLRPRT